MKSHEEATKELQRYEAQDKLKEEVSKIAAAEPATAQATETAPVEATPVVEAAPVAEVAPAEPISVATKKEAAKPA